MKKILVVLAFLVFSFSNAQKGSILVMGSATYYSTNSSASLGENKQNTINLQPKIGYQFHENWTSGIEANFTNTKQNSYDESQYKDNAYSLGGFLRYTKTLNNTFSAYADLGVGYQNRRQINTLATGRYYTDNDGMYASITPAVFINISKGFGLNFNIGGLNYTTMDYDGSSGINYKSKSFQFNLGQAISVGISKNF